MFKKIAWGFVVVAAILAAGFNASPDADATPNSYIYSLQHDPNYTFTGPDVTYLKMGFAICYDILSGISADDLINNVMRQGSYDAGAAKKIIANAIVHLCSEPGSLQVDSPTSGKRRI